MKFLFSSAAKQPFTDIGLLLMRLWAGGIMFYAHGWGKLNSFSQQIEIRDGFLGMPGELAATLLVFAEVFCAILLALGAATRAVAVPLFITMMIAAFVGHGGDPFGDKELALFYGAAYLMVFFTGPGKYSVDHLITGK